jgi:hypothetical protein
VIRWSGDGFVFKEWRGGEKGRYLGSSFRDSSAGVKFAVGVRAEREDSKYSLILVDEFKG